MVKIQLAGIVLVCLGLVVLFILRGVLLRFLVLIIEFFGVFLGFLLILLGIAMIVGSMVIQRPRLASVDSRFRQEWKFGCDHVLVTRR